MCESKWPTWQVVETQKMKEREREQEEQQEMKKKGSKTTDDMKAHPMQNTTNATRCYVIPEKAELLKNGMTGSPKIYKQ